MQKIKETGDSRYIYPNKLDKDYFEHDMAYGVFKDLPRRTTSDKVLHNKAFNFAKNPKYAEYQISLASMVYKFFIKSLLVVLLNSKLFQIDKAEKLPKPIIRKFKNAIYTLFLKITFGKYSNYNKRFRFLL